MRSAQKNYSNRPRSELWLRPSPVEPSPAGSCHKRHENHGYDVERQKEGHKEAQVEEHSISTMEETLQRICVLHCGATKQSNEQLTAHQQPNPQDDKSDKMNKRPVGRPLPLRCHVRPSHVCVKLRYAVRTDSTPRRRVAEREAENASKENLSQVVVLRRG